MILYLDSSALVKRYFQERGSHKVLTAWREAEGIAISVVAWAECLAAFHRKKREGTLSTQELNQVVSQLKQDWGSFILIHVSSEINQQVEQILKRRPLRGFDALHLASAVVIKKKLKETPTFACADQHLNTAAGAEGLEVLDVGED